MIMKPTMSCFAVLLFLELLAIATSSRDFRSASSYVPCIDSEKQALLRFKKDLIDSSHRLASWTADGDCCTWVGVVCDNFTGHVLELRLGNPNAFDEYWGTLGELHSYERLALSGKINPSLLDLKHLLHLDLSGNHFQGNQIPTFLGSMKNLRYLNLSGSGFFGMIPHQLGNLSNLQYLDLCNQRNDFFYSRPAKLYVDNFQWVSDLHLLKHLDLGRVNLSKTFDQWLLITNVLPSLAVLKLSYCQLHHLPPLFVANFSSLTSLDLSSNLFYNTLIPSWVFSLSHLVSLDLGGNNFQGPIPDGIQNFTSLLYLDLSGNSFNFSIPNWLYQLGHLEHLDLRDNALQGSISDVPGNLTSIMELDLSFNRLEGKIPRTFERLCNLKSISFFHIKLKQDISEILDILSGCISNQLESLELSGSQLFGHLTNQLGHLKNIKFLDISYNSISGPIPPCLGELSSLRVLVIANNKLNGSLSEIHFAKLTSLVSLTASGNLLALEVGKDWTPPFRRVNELDLGSSSLGPQFSSWFLTLELLLYLDISNSGIVDTVPNKFWKFLSQLVFFNLSHNQIQGHILNLLETSKLETLDLSSNNLSGPLPSLSSHVSVVNFSNNTLSGSISHFLCYRMHESKRMRILNLQKNLLYGEIPDCLMNWRALQVLSLSKNKFVGKLPTSIGTLSSLQSLHLRGNNLSGTIPMSLKNCTELVALELGENSFVGNVPNWIGEKLSKLTILNLRANNFHGLLPIELCFLKHLQILDLAYNNLSGRIPRCIGNLSAMVETNFSESYDIPYDSNATINYGNEFLEDASIVIKGKAVEYNTILKLVISIDLSKNSFSGKIPREITNLRALMSLNLSHNSLIGRIPESINEMTNLESIDLSKNQLSGEIPQTISALTFLSLLNVSSNHLTGKIPTSTQLQSLNASCFAGNELCGSPLPNKCTVPNPDEKSGGGNDDNGGDHEVDWFYVSMAIGFVVGFWSVIGPLLVQRRWSYIYSHFLDGLEDKFVSLVSKCC